MNKEKCAICHTEYAVSFFRTMSYGRPICEKCFNKMLAEKIEKHLTKMTEKEIVIKLMELYFDLHEEITWDDDFEAKYNREDVLGDMEEYEIEDMDEFIEKYPYMNSIPYGIVYAMQKYYNAEYLCAGWCGCATPETLIKVFSEWLERKNKGENK